MYTNICDRCGKEFESKSKNSGRKDKARLYCSKECKHNNFSRFDEWREEEVSELKRLSKLMPKKQVVYAFRQNAKLKGWTKRTYIAVGCHLRSLQLDRDPTPDREWYTTRELAKVLNIHYARVSKKWRDNGLAWSFNCGKRTCTLHIGDIKKYAARRPRDFYGIPVGKLNIIFRDLAFSKEIFELAFADSFSNCFCIVRLQGGVFRSVGDCADKLVLSQSAIESNVKREKPISVRGSHDLVKLNYPIYLAPEGYEDEFNELAGNILIQLYAEYKNIEGYSKLGIQVISVRQAVQIAIVSFRSFFRDKSLGVVKRSKEAIAEFWKDRYIKIYLWHFQVSNYNSSRNRVCRNLRVKCIGLFSSTYQQKAEQYFAEFCDYFISKFGETYLKDQYLPEKLRENKYIYSDIWLFVECMSLASIIKLSGLPLARAIAYNFVEANKPDTNYNPEWLEHNVHSEPTADIEIILKGLDELNLEDSYKDLCNQYIQGFLKYGDAAAVKEELNIEQTLESEILGTLRLATMPF